MTELALKAACWAVVLGFVEATLFFIISFLRAVQPDEEHPKIGAER
jgi:hypothetical protein